MARSVRSGMTWTTRLVQPAGPSSTIRLFLAVSALALVSSGVGYSQTTPPPADGVGFIGDTLHPQVSGARFSPTP
ncbi:MAG TPA: hypothetical protein VEA63_11715, partial [Opitutus sp.]|nr:hypothetical protein [Opitutus sp.]